MFIGIVINKEDINIVPIYVQKEITPSFDYLSVTMRGTGISAFNKNTDSSIIEKSVQASDRRGEDAGDVKFTIYRDSSHYDQIAELYFYVQ